MSDLETQLSDQLDRYIAAFNTRDFPTAASHYHEPAVAISSAAGVTILPARADLAAFLSATVDRLVKDGFDHSEWMGLKKVVVLGEGLVLVSCACRRVRKDGSSCEEFAVIYTLRRMGEGWRIVAIHQHDVGTQLK